MEARVERRWLGRSTRASLRCTKETETADGSAETGPGSCIGAATPRAAVCPTAFGCVAGWRVLHPVRRGRGRSVDQQWLHSGGLKLPTGPGLRAGPGLCAYARGRGRCLMFLCGDEVAAHQAPEADQPAAGQVTAVVMHSTQSPARCHSGKPAPESALQGRTAASCCPTAPTGAGCPAR